MKRSLMVFAAISAFIIPALAPVAVLAQDISDRGQEDLARSPRRDGGRPGNREETADSGGVRERQGRDASGDRQAPSLPPQDTAPRRDSSGGDRDRGNRGGNDGNGGGRWGNGGNGRPDRPQTPTPTPTPTPPPSQPDRPGGNGGWNGGGNADNGGNRPRRDDSDRGNDDWNRNRGGDQNRPNRPDRGNDGPGGWDGSNGGNRPDGGRPGTGGGWTGNDRNRPGNDWNSGSDRNRDRDRSRNEYRNRFDSSRWQQNWNRSHRSDWWRSDRRFNGWSGVRFGFYFAPGYGYYSVPRSYYGRQYYVGDYLPSIFWRYSVNDYRTYGLGYPPEGTRWVYVDNAIYLIDQYDGYIIDVIRNAWRW